MPKRVKKAVEMGALFETYHDRIYRYVLHIVRNPAEAEDLTQDTFLRACRGQESLRDPDAVRSWLYRIATHVCLDRLRQRKTHAPIESVEGLNRLESSISAPPAAEEVTERRETSACVQRCLDFLPDSYRAVILLYEAHSLTAPEIAQLLGVSTGSVKIRLHRARHRLEQVMRQGCCLSHNREGVLVCEPKS